MKGFSLVELMIVMAVLVILAVLAYPSYADSVRKTRRAEGQMALIEAMGSQERYYAEHRSYKVFSATDTELEGFRWWSGSSAATSAYELDAFPCAGYAADQCIVLRARPGTERVDSRFRDPECGVLTLDSAGRQFASGTSLRCWP